MDCFLAILAIITTLIYLIISTINPELVQGAIEIISICVLYLLVRIALRGRDV